MRSQQPPSPHQVRTSIMSQQQGVNNATSNPLMGNHPVSGSGSGSSPLNPYRTKIRPLEKAAVQASRIGCQDTSGRPPQVPASKSKTNSVNGLDDANNNAMNSVMGVGIQTRDNSMSSSSSSMNPCERMNHQSLNHGTIEAQTLGEEKKLEEKKLAPLNIYAPLSPVNPCKKPVQSNHGSGSSIFSQDHGRDVSSNPYVKPNSRIVSTQGPQKFEMNDTKPTTKAANSNYPSLSQSNGSMLSNPNPYSRSATGTNPLLKQASISDGAQVSLQHEMSNPYKRQCVQTSHTNSTMGASNVNAETNGAAKRSDESYSVEQDGLEIVQVHNTSNCKESNTAQGVNPAVAARKPDPPNTLYIDLTQEDEPMKSTDQGNRRSAVPIVTKPAIAPSQQLPVQQQQRAIPVKKSNIPPLPPELLYDEDRLKPINDEHRLKLIKAADLGGTLKNGWTLLPHQKVGVLKAIQMRRLVLAYDMGLGKLCNLNNSWNCKHSCTHNLFCNRQEKH